MSTSKIRRRGRRSLGLRVGLLQNVFSSEITTGMTAKEILERSISVGGPSSQPQISRVLIMWEDANLVRYSEGRWSMVSPSFEVNHERK